MLEHGSALTGACAARPVEPPATALDPVRSGRRRALRRTRSPVGTVLLDMGGVVIPTLFESTAVPGFPAGPTGPTPSTAPSSGARSRSASTGRGWPGAARTWTSARSGGTAPTCGAR